MHPSIHNDPSLPLLDQDNRESFGKCYRMFDARLIVPRDFLQLYDIL